MDRIGSTLTTTHRKERTLRRAVVREFLGASWIFVVQIFPISRQQPTTAAGRGEQVATANSRRIRSSLLSWSSGIYMSSEDPQECKLSPAGKNHTPARALDKS